MNTEPAFDDVQAPAASEGPRINGRAVSRDGDDPVVVPIAGLDDIAGLEGIAWRPSYDRESIDRYLAAVEAEKSRLRAEIRLAEERAATAQERCQASSTERDALLGTLLLTARAEMDRVDTEHRTRISAIYALAEEESARIRDQAQADASAVREVVASLSTMTAPGGSTHGARTESADDAAADPGSRDQRNAD